ncbi:MAG: hypothetical protein QOF85_1792 [Solirubrobacterales bacterium]|jgi:uncharacterized protein (DUF2236 family)|nr:hypothetical protein [Solirubrobacterales bacterium]
MTHRDYYFPPGESVARHVHEQRAVGVLYGQRAVLIGALEPRAYTGTMLSTRSRDRPFLRLTRTAKIQETVLLGTREEADRALASVHRLHRRVRGKLPSDMGQFAAGDAQYSAFDPDLMLWTLAVIVDSAVAIYEALVRALGDGERERLWADYLLFGELFGIPREMMPASAPEFSRWLDRRMRSTDLRATAHALEVAPIMAFEHPVPAAMRPGLHVNNLLIKGTLPERVREIFGINWGGRHEASFRALASTHRHLRHLLPRQIRRGRNDFFFDLVARTEGRRGGTEVPDLAETQNS